MKSHAMICCCIQCHGEIDHIPWLLTCLAHPDFRLLVSYDGPSEKVARLQHAIQESSLAVHVVHSIPVTWGGRTVVEAMLNSLRTALEHWPDVESVIFMSGTCFPLMPPAEISAFLGAKRQAKKEAFLSDYRPKWHGPPAVPSEPNTGTYIEWRQMKGKGAGIYYDESLQAQFVLMSDSPVLRPVVRFYLHATESTHDRTIHVRSLTAEERSLRQELAARHPIHCGRQWIVVSRAIGEWLIDPANCAEMREQLLHSFIPDEMFFQTLMHSMPPALLQKVETKNYRLEGGKPLKFSDGNYEEMLRGNWGKLLSGRKILHQSAPRFRAELSKLCHPGFW